MDCVRRVDPGGPGDALMRYERLSAQDNTFLVFETPNSHLHVCGTSLYRAGPFQTASGGIDVAAYRKATQAVLHLVPRYRQKLRWIPFENHPVWVDDPDFNLEYHIRHTALPRPGGMQELKRLTARILDQPLDR
jgi:hypothetical protein